MKSGLLALTVVLLVVRGPGVAGQRIDSPYRFVEHSQGAGAYAALVSPAAGRLRLGPQSAAGAGVRYGISISGPLAVELDLLYSPTTRSVGDTVLTTPDSLPVIKGEADLGLLIAMGSIRFNITGGRTWHGLQPFVLFGAGIGTDIAGRNAVSDSLPADARFDFGTSFAGQLGAGTEWYPSARWSLRVDARNALWKLKHPPAFRAGARSVVVPPDEWEGNLILSLGLSMHF
jgi:pimeloyl-ACP methyl ester carboxylesterase